MVKQKLHKIISFVLLLFFAVPLIYQPAHYFIFPHDNIFSAHTHPIQLNEQHNHLICVIDNFQITELLPNRIDNYIQKQDFCIELNTLYKSVFVKNIFFPYSFLRAPPQFIVMFKDK